MAKRFFCSASASANYKLMEWLHNTPHAFFISELNQLRNMQPPSCSIHELSHIEEQVLPELFASVAEDFFIKLRVQQ